MAFFDLKGRGTLSRGEGTEGQGDKETKRILFEQTIIVRRSLLL
jgi:hypothetical protein